MLTELPGQSAWRRAVPWVGDVASGAIIIFSALGPSPFGSPSAPVTALVMLPALFLPLRRRWPIAVVVANAAIFAIAALTGVLAGGVGFALAVSLFSVAIRTDRRTTLITAGAVTGLVFLASVPVVLETIYDPRVFQFVFLLAFAAAAGDGARTRRKYIAAVIERAERAEQTREEEAQRRVTEERLKIARDLHDAVAHQIAVISLNAGVASSTLETDPQRTRDALGSIRSAARTVLSEIGDLMNVLRADDSSAAAAPQPDLTNLQNLVDDFHAHGLEVQVRIVGDLARADGIVGMVGYKVIQEAFTNAHKYGGEGRASVLLDATGDSLEIVVSNPLPATPRPTEAQVGVGVGLVGIRERVAAVRGTVEAGAALGGWRVKAVIPFAKEDPS